MILDSDTIIVIDKCKRKQQFRHELMASDTSGTVEIIKR